MKRKFVIVYWHDIAGIQGEDANNSWLTKDELINGAEKLFSTKYTTRGELVYENKDYIIVAASSDNDPENRLYSDASMIPKSVIIKIEKLK